MSKVSTKDIRRIMTNMLKRGECIQGSCLSCAFSSGLDCYATAHPLVQANFPHVTGGHRNNYTTEELMELNKVAAAKVLAEIEMEEALSGQT